MMNGWILFVLFLSTPALHTEEFGDQYACEQVARTIREWRQAAAMDDPDATSKMFVTCFPRGLGTYPMRMGQ